MTWIYIDRIEPLSDSHRPQPCLVFSAVMKPFVEESVFFQALNSSRFRRNFLRLVNTENRHGVDDWKRLSRSSEISCTKKGEETHKKKENINPSSPVRFWIFWQMFGLRDYNFLSICPFSAPPTPMSFYQHLVFSAAGKQVFFINHGFPVSPLRVLLA